MRHHILAISSDRNMLHTLEFILEADQFIVYTATGWAEVHELLNRREHPIHLMIFDTNVSGGIGLEQLGAATMRNIPIIVLTGSPRWRRQRNAPEWKGIVWMEKPVGRESLLSTIKSLVSDRNDSNAN